MTTSKRGEAPRAVDVSVSDDYLSVELADGRRVSVPLAWFPRLLDASAEQRDHWEFVGDGQGIHWPDIDEDSASRVCCEATRRRGRPGVRCDRAVGSGHGSAYAYGK